MNPFSVRFRLFALCLGLFLTVGAANLFLGHLIYQHNDQQQKQLEQFRRLETIHSALQAMSLYRHWQGQFNADVLSGSKVLSDHSREELRVSREQFEQRLAEVEKFDPASVEIVRASFQRLPEHMDKAILALRSREAQLAEVHITATRDMLNTIQETFNGAIQRERQLVDAIQEQELLNVQATARLSVAVILLSCVIGIVIIFVIVSSILQPLQKTVVALRQVNAGETSIDLPPVGRDEFGDVAVALRQFRDQTERLRHMAYNDPLTGLGNRAKQDEELNRAIEGCRREGGSLAVMYVDLDNFSAINDSLGHSAGDRYLCEAALRLRRFIPEDAQVLRYSGDKFTVLLEDLPLDDPLTFLRTVSDNVLRGMAEPIQFSGNLLPMSVSIGIAMYPADGETGEHIVSSADAAMYRAKHLGRNKAYFASPELRAGLRRQLTIATEMQHGLENGEFEPFYQPVLDVRSGRVTGAEALLRWHHPQRGILLAGEFIPVAEQSGLIGALGERCLHLASAQALRWQDSRRDIRVSINLSARQIDDGSVITLLERMHRDSNGNTPSLDFEITETAMLEQIEKTQSTLKRIRAMGHFLGVDDFGTGYSSMVYLQRFPVNRIKIDKSFVAQMDTSKEALAIIAATVALASSLDLDVIAEGVESEDQMLRLRDLGCYLQQGFHFTPALPSVEFEAWLDARPPSAANPPAGQT